MPRTYMGQVAGRQTTLQTELHETNSILRSLAKSLSIDKETAGTTTVSEATSVDGSGTVKGPSGKISIAGGLTKISKQLGSIKTIMKTALGATKRIARAAAGIGLLAIAFVSFKRMIANLFGIETAGQKFERKVGITSGTDGKGMMVGGIAALLGIGALTTALGGLTAGFAKLGIGAIALGTGLRRFGLLAGAFSIGAYFGKVVDDMFKDLTGTSIGAAAIPESVASGREIRSMTGDERLGDLERLRREEKRLSGFSLTGMFGDEFTRRMTELKAVKARITTHEKMGTVSTIKPAQELPVMTTAMMSEESMIHFGTIVGSQIAESLRSGAENYAQAHTSLGNTDKPKQEVK